MISNNKQSMKLYTEEQVIQMIEKSRETGLTAEYLILTTTPIKLPSDSLCINCDESKSTHNLCMDCMIKIGKENIELPSDEEIEREARLYCNIKESLVIDEEERYYKDFQKYDGFKACAQWVRDKIQGGKK